MQAASVPLRKLVQWSDAEGTKGTHQVSKPRPRSWGVGVGETLCLRNCYCHSQEEKRPPQSHPHLQADTDPQLRDNTEGLPDTGFLKALHHIRGPWVEETHGQELTFPRPPSKPQQ